MDERLKHHPDDIVHQDGTTGFVLNVNRPILDEELARGTIKTENGFRLITREELKTKKTTQLVYLPYRVLVKLTKEEIRNLNIANPPEELEDKPIVEIREDSNNFALEII
jgi:hypothetical protein